MGKFLFIYFALVVSNLPKINVCEVPGSLTQFSNITDSAHLSNHPEHHISEFLTDKHFLFRKCKNLVIAINLP